MPELRGAGAAWRGFFLFVSMTMMTSCPGCEGFVPANLDICPHCNRAEPPTRSSVGARVLQAAGTAAMAVTLMACYGAMNYADDQPGYNGEYCEYGQDPYGECNDPPEPNTCGDGTLDSGEACDDGNYESADGCSTYCTIELCAQATPLPLGVSNGSTLADASSQEFHSQCGGFVGYGRERVYQFAADDNGSLLVSVSGGMGLYASRSCDSVNSVDTFFPATGEHVCAPPGELLDVPVTAGELVYVVVDTPAGAEAGGYTLDAQFVHACGDGKLQTYASESCDGGVAAGDMAQYCQPGCTLDVVGYCAAAAALTAGNYTGDTSGGIFANSGPGCAGNDDLLAFTAPQAGTFIAVAQADFDVSLKIMDQCADASLAQGACDNISAAGQQEAAVRVLSAGQTVWLVVDGAKSGDGGDYNLTIDFVGADGP